MPKAVLFDLDGTLFDHEGAASAALTAWLPTVGLAVSPEVLDRWFDAEQLYVGQWRAGVVSWQEQRRLRLRLVPRLERAADGELDAAFEGYLRRYESGWRAFDDVEPTLDRLERVGLRLGMLTNGATLPQHAKLAALGLTDRFDFVLISEELHLGKPDPIAFLTACDRFRFPAGEVVHVGDLPDLDVAAAHAAGLRAVLIDRRDLYKQPGSLRSLLELPDWIRALSTTGSAAGGSSAWW